MFIMYIDESGDTVSLSQGGKHFLVLTGCVIEEKDSSFLMLQKRASDILSRGPFLMGAICIATKHILTHYDH